MHVRTIIVRVRVQAGAGKPLFEQSVAPVNPNFTHCVIARIDNVRQVERNGITFLNHPVCERPDSRADVFNCDNFRDVNFAAIIVGDG